MSAPTSSPPPAPPQLEGLCGFQVLVMYKQRVFVLEGYLKDEVRKFVEREVASRDPSLANEPEACPIWAP